MSLARHDYRAIVVGSISPTRKLIQIPKLYSDPTSHPVQAQSAYDFPVGSRVIVSDLSGSHASDWYIAQYENMIEHGPGSPDYAHTHALGHIDGLVDVLNNKSNAPGPWKPITLRSGITIDGTQSGPNPQARMTSIGLQLQSRRLRGPSTAPAADQVFCTIPPGLAPPYDITFSIAVQRSGAGNTGASVVMKLRTGTGDIQWVSAPTTNTSQGTGGGPADYITLNNTLIW